MSDENTRERILSVTCELLNQQDEIRNITVSQVAAAADVSRATLYRYFPNKATLLRAAGVTNEQIGNITTTRERILEATIEIVGERGMHSATFEEIADRANLSVSGLHWHYRNKDELFADLAQHIPLVATIAAEVAQADTDEADIEKQLTRLITVLLTEANKRAGAVRYLLFEAEIYPEVARLASKHTLGRALPLLAQFFEHHERRGNLRPGSAQARAQALLGMLLVQITFRPAFTSLLASDEQETARQYVDILLHGILAKPQGE